jgi:hypothetical protein
MRLKKSVRVLESFCKDYNCSQNSPAKGSMTKPADWGDVIPTGTPAGAAVGGKGPYLQAGDVMECMIERLGTLRNAVVKEKA